MDGATANAQHLAMLDSTSVDETVRFNRSVYAKYYRNPFVSLRYDLRYRAQRIAWLLSRHGVDPSAPGFAAFEYGFGEGQLLRVVSQAQTVVGFEMSPSAVERAQRRAPPGHPDWRMQVWEDATDLKLPSDTFDLATASHVLEHVPDDETALDELIRIVKPGGNVLILLPANEQLFEGSKHLRLYDRDEFRQRLSDRGLREVAVDEHQRFDRPFKHHRLILQSRRGPLRKAMLEGTKAALFLPPQLLSWRTLAKLDEALATVGAPSSSIAYLFQKP